jgi:type II secretory pathway pseudopilin PulG
MHWLGWAAEGVRKDTKVAVGWPAHPCSLPTVSASRARRRRALTLLELIISIALIAMLMSSLMVFYWQVMSIREQASARAEQTQIARQVLDRIASELRATLGTETLGFPVAARLQGDRRSITFLSAGLPTQQQYHIYRESETPPAASHDLREVSYSLWVDEDKKDEDGNPLIGGIIRTEKKTLNQFIVDEEDVEQLRTDLWAPELGYLEFRYYDGVQWDTIWDLNEGNSLPQLIMITVGFSPVTQAELDNTDLQDFPIEEYPFGDNKWRSDRFSVIVRIPTADRFFSSRFQRMGKQMSQQMGVEAR